MLGFNQPNLHGMHRWQASLWRRDEGPYRSWLKTQGSLTRRLQRRCRRFRVEPLRTSLTPALSDEGWLGARRRLWAREVLLRCDERPVVFARSLTPYRPRHRLDRLLRGLGSRALGSVLFSDPRFERELPYFRRIDARDALYRRVAFHLRSAAPAVELPPQLWARRARYRLSGKALWVMEVFLPAVV
ncbi:MAG TPA: chorismate lyase, partial [Rhodocyclaceae bacterium]|nr:chorismate lyase [Rhodocyclaceae bacterium]